MSDAPRTATSLYGRLISFDLSDPEAEVGFEASLANENGWTQGYATQVCKEYRRFLFLTQCAGQPMCPSDDVDQAWHLHLTQTRSYQKMCVDVLGRFLHHDKSREGPNELRRHQAMYEATLHAYKTTFNEAPPAAIWPETADRFRPSRSPVREASVRVPGFLRGVAVSWLGWMLMAAAAGWLMHKGGTAAMWADLEGDKFAGVYLIVLASIVGIFHARRKLRGTDGLHPPTLDPYEVAWLAGGQERVIGTALASLVDRGILAMVAQREADKITGGTCHRTGVAYDRLALHDMERTCLAAIPAGNVDMDHIRQAASHRCQAIARRLECAGLLHRPGYLARERAVAGWVLAAMLAIGFSRLWFGLAMVHSVWFLAMLLVVNAHFATRMFNAIAAPTWRGLRALEDLARPGRSAPRDAQQQHVRGSPEIAGAGSLVTLAFALFGTQAVMAMDHFAGINYLFGSGNGNVTGDSKSVSGCGAGCGGGCGGCGGCGG